MAEFSIEREALEKDLEDYENRLKSLQTAQARLDEQRKAAVKTRDEHQATSLKLAGKTTIVGAETFVTEEYVKLQKAVAGIKLKLDESA